MSSVLDIAKKLNKAYKNDKLALKADVIPLTEDWHVMTLEQTSLSMEVFLMAELSPFREKNTVEKPQVLVFSLQHIREQILKELVSM